MATTEVDLTAKDIADRTRLTPRMVNIYRAEAEARLGYKLGYKQGRTTYFRPDEVREILKSREAQPSGNPRTSQNFREPSDFSNLNNQAEDSILTGMDAIVQAGDQNAIAVGQALGQRWNQLMWTAALQSMQSGMVDMQTRFEEMHTSVSLTFNQPQLPGGQTDFLLQDGDGELS